MIVLGTGFKECILSGLLSQAKLKVLNIDRNKYYGAETASLNLEQLFEKFAPGVTPPENLGRSRNWCVDLCPKFIMGCGNLVKILVHTDVTRYLEFTAVSGSFVVQDKAVHKVPVTPTEALSSGLMGFFEKRRFKNFLEWVNGYEQDKADTHQGFNAKTQSAQEAYKFWSLSDEVAAFTGHAIALYDNDNYLRGPALDLINKAKLYANSLARFKTSPFLYPKYGISGIPEGFARMCAIFGGVQMLEKQVEGLTYGDDKKVNGVKVDGQVIKTKAVLADPSFLLDTPKVKMVGKVCRAICILNHPVPNTNNTDSCQIIIPAKQTGRKNDIYVAVVSSAQNVCSQGYYVACVSSIMESKEEKTATSELQPAFDLLGTISHKFTWVAPRFVAADDGTADNVFVTSSLDASSHFEAETEELLSLYPRVSGGKVFDLNSTSDIKQE